MTVFERHGITREEVQAMFDADEDEDLPSKD
jgi:hypothetical protein